MNLSRVGPGGEAGQDIELAKQAADDLIGVSSDAELVDLGHHSGQRALNVFDGLLRIMLALAFQAALTAHEFFTIETGKGMKNRTPGWA